MASNTTLNSGSGGDSLVTKQVSHDGDTAKLQGVFLMGISGTEDAYTAAVLSQIEDAAHSSGDHGIMGLAVRNDTLAALAGTDGDYAPLQVNASGALYIQEGAALDVSGATVTVTGTVTADAGTGTMTVDLGANNDVTIDNSSIVLAEDAAHNTGDAGVMSLAVRNDTLAALATTDGDYAPLQVNASGALFIQEGAAMDVSAATVTVDNAGTFATQVNGDALTALQLIDNIVVVEDAAHGSGDSGVMGLAVRNDTLAALAGTDGDYAPLQVDASGALYTQIAGQEANLTVDLGATDNAVLDSIVTNTTGLNNAVSGNELQVDVVAALPAGTNAIGKLAANSGVDIGDVDILSIAAGSNLVGDVGLGVRTSGGTSTYYDADLDETAVAVKSSAGNIYSIQAFNTTAAPLFLQLFNVAQGSVTVGTTTPTNQYVIPGNADSDGAGVVINLPVPKSYGTAITAACSTDSEGNGAPGAGACIVNIEYA